ncbi:MAG TPA: hypothetical protein PK014_02720 [Thermoanaerobaculia bacterium]|nr:hypothetical protein [Thermoanaerobaculia bacterium]HUM28852.1 hypothetical protein [Thermoanaerobaculia bacterium]HXK67214.1 hypothetical protein [Thermoanaerobaculia bacterium]
MTYKYPQKKHGVSPKRKDFYQRRQKERRKNRWKALAIFLGLIVILCFILFYR